MAKTIKESNNYIVIDDEGTSGLLVFPKTSVYSETSISFNIRVEPRSEVFEIQFSRASDWKTDDSGTTAFTTETLREFLQTNTWGKIRNRAQSYILLKALKLRATYYENATFTTTLLDDLDDVDLLEKASMITTPTAYSEGVLHSVKPEQTFGSELVTNGDFGNDTNNWTPNPNATLTIDNDKLKVTINGASGYPSQSITTEIGKTYRITANSFIGTSSRLALYNTGDGQFRNLYEDGSFDFTITAASTSTQLRLYVYGDGSYGLWDNISVKEVTDADFTFTRGSSATRVNEQGLIESVGVDLPRIDYTNGSGSLLLEPSRSNKLSTSNDFNGSGWLISDITATANQVVSPDGTLNASKLEMTGNGSLRNISEASFNDGYAYSIFIKKGNSRYVTIRSAFFTQSIVVGFDLDTLTAQTNGKIEDYGNDWYRLSITKDISGDVDRSGFFYLYLPNSLGSQTSVSGNYIYAYGGQIEDGSYATSYIPTQGGVVTRSTETANGSGDVDTFNDSEGVFFRSKNKPTQLFQSISIKDSIGNGLAFKFRNDNTSIWARYKTSTEQKDIYYYNNVNDNYNKLAIVYGNGSIGFYINGFLIGSNTITTNFSNLNEIIFKDVNLSEIFYGNVKQLQYFDSALTDQELIALTTI